MRPINKPAPNLATYPYQFRLDNMGNLQADAGATNVGNFTSAGIKTAMGVPGQGGNVTPTTWFVLDGMQFVLIDYPALVARLSPVLPPANDTARYDALQSAWTAITDHIGDAYKLASNPMSGVINKLCCYCDQIINDTIDIEHVVPKGAYPLFSLPWANFVLGCSVCNSANKGVKPLRTTIDVWPAGTYGPPYADEIARYNQIREHYLWPDSSADSYVNLMPKLQYRETLRDPWADLTPPDRGVAAGVHITGVDLRNRSVQANIPLMGPAIGGPIRRIPRRVLALRPAYVRVVMDPVGAAAVASVELMGLSKDGTEGTTAGDTRMYNWTLEWFNCVELLRPALQNYVASWTPAMSATGHGNFPIWIRVLDLLGGRTAKVSRARTARTLLEQFIADTARGDRFPNTNTANIPLR